LKVEIKNWTILTRGLTQSLIRKLQIIRPNGDKKFLLLFESKLREAKSCDERGDIFRAMEHKLLAEIINYFLKSLDR
jgi:hypothetical protein